VTAAGVLVALAAVAVVVLIAVDVRRTGGWDPWAEFEEEPPP
jgi:hypothetical protein